MLVLPVQRVPLALGVLLVRWVPWVTQAHRVQRARLEQLARKVPPARLASRVTRARLARQVLRVRLARQVCRVIPAQRGRSEQLARMAQPVPLVRGVRRVRRVPARLVPQARKV